MIFVCFVSLLCWIHSFITTACVLSLWEFLHLRLYLQRQFYFFLSNLHASNSSCLTALARTSSTMLNRGGRVGILGLFFLVKKPSVFHCHSVLSIVLLLAWLVFHILMSFKKLKCSCYPMLPVYNTVIHNF